MAVMDGPAPAEVFASRGWSAAEWSAARDRLTARGWIDAEGTATERGREGRDEIEWRTDRLADAPWRPLGADRAERLAELTGPLLGAAFESGLLPRSPPWASRPCQRPPRDPEPAGSAAPTRPASKTESRLAEPRRPGRATGNPISRTSSQPHRTPRSASRWPASTPNR